MVMLRNRGAPSFSPDRVSETKHLRFFWDEPEMLRRYSAAGENAASLTLLSMTLQGKLSALSVQLSAGPSALGLRSSGRGRSSAKGYSVRCPTLVFSML